MKKIKEKKRAMGGELPAKKDFSPITT